MLLFVADLLNERNKDGSYASNSMDAIVAINSLDYSPVGNADQWTKGYETLKSELLVFGEEAGFTSAGLEGWPTSHAKRQPISAHGRWNDSRSCNALRHVTEPGEGTVLGRIGDVGWMEPHRLLKERQQVRGDSRRRILPAKRRSRHRYSVWCRLLMWFRLWC